MFCVPVVVIGTLISLLAFFLVSDSLEHSRRDELHAKAFEKTLQIERTIRADVASLNALPNLLSASGPVEPDQFRRLRDLVDLAPGIRSLHWAPRVPASGRREFEDRIRHSGSPAFRIWEPGAGGLPVAAELFPVLYSNRSTADGNSWLGLNIAAQSLQVAEVEAARLSGETVISEASSPLHVEDGLATGLMAIVPVFEGESRPDLAQRLAQTKGLILAEISTASLVREALGDTADRTYGIEVRSFDQFDGSYERPNVRIGPDHGAPMSAEGKEVIARRLFDFAGRSWDVVVTLEDPPDRFGFLPAWIVLALGFANTAALAFFFNLIQSRREAAEREATTRSQEIVGTERRLSAEIAQRTSIEQELKESRERIRDAIECLDAGFALFDAEQRLICWNSKYLDFDRDIAESFKVGVTFQELADAGAEADQWMERPDSGAAAREALIVPSARARQLRDGRWLLVKLQSTSEGGLVDIRTDITDLKVRAMELEDHRDRLEELAAERTRDLEEQACQLREALQKEREYNALQDEFVSMVSHEFRTPLAIIDGAAQLMQRKAQGLDPDDLTARVGKIRRAVRRLVSLIESTLSFSCIESGRMALSLREFDLRQLVIEHCEQQGQISAQHKITWDLDALPDCVVADPNLIGQVVSNLLSNAVKYSPRADRVEVSARTTKEALAISVRDYGLGIPEADLPRLFDRFFRAGNVTGIAGTGIGLNLCRTMLELHGGSLDVVSKEGEGSLFTLRLPISAAVTPEGSMPQAAAS